MSHEEELRLLLVEVVEAFEKAGITSRLVGAMAIKLLMDRLPPTEDTVRDIDPSVPWTLARAVHPTKDIDLLVTESRLAGDVLRRMGFEPISEPPLHYRRGSQRVDLIPASENRQTTDPFHIPGAICLPQDLPLGTTHSRVSIASPGALLAMKAVAIADATRGKSSDLSDFGALAVACHYLGWPTEADLERAAATWPPVQPALKAVRVTFLEGNGAAVFANMVREADSGMHQSRWEEYEEEIQRIAVDAVLNVLRGYSR